MIYNNDFIWLHFPKCAGTKIEKLFTRYLAKQKGIHMDTIDIRVNPDVSWHDSIEDRINRDPTFLVGSRAIICPFRKLPKWLESRFNFEVMRNPALSHNPAFLLEGKFLESNGYKNHADYYVRKYLPETILGSEKIRFLRTEFFEADFKEIFSDYLDISSIPDHEYKKTENASKSFLPAKIKQQLSDNITELYNQCPYWKHVEEIAYDIKNSTTTV